MSDQPGMTCPRCGAELEEVRQPPKLGEKSITWRTRCSAKCGYERLPESTGQRRKRNAKEQKMADAAERRQRRGMAPDDAYWVDR